MELSLQRLKNREVVALFFTVYIYIYRIDENRTVFKNLPSVRLLESLEFKLTGTEQISFYKDSEGKDIYFEGGVFERIL